MLQPVFTFLGVFKTDTKAHLKCYGKLSELYCMTLLQGLKNIFKTSPYYRNNIMRSYLTLHIAQIKNTTYFPI